METKSVSQIKTLLQARKISRESFRLPYSQAEVYDMLHYAVDTELRSRCVEPVATDEQLRQVREAAQFLTDGKHFGLMIMGTTGNGKTTLMRAIQGLINVCDLTDIYGRPLMVREFSAKDIVRMAKDDYPAFSKICREPAIAIDDFGEEPIEVVSYGNAFNPLVDLLSIRYDQQLLTILTTNTPNKDIRTIYGARIADRLNEMMQVLIFNKKSYRGRAKYKTEKKS